MEFQGVVSCCFECALTELENFLFTLTELLEECSPGHGCHGFSDAVPEGPSLPPMIGQMTGILDTDQVIVNIVAIHCNIQGKLIQELFEHALTAAQVPENQQVLSSCALQEGCSAIPVLKVLIVNMTEIIVAFRPLPSSVSTEFALTHHDSTVCQPALDILGSDLAQHDRDIQAQWFGEDTVQVRIGRQLTDNILVHEICNLLTQS